MQYIYSFKCRDDIEYFDRLPDAAQASIEMYIVKVIYDSFVKPADEDYVTARLLALKGMHRAFFWAASQALEKYLKAFLLMRGFSVNLDRFKGHPVSALHTEACSIDTDLRIETKPHVSIKIAPEVIEVIDELTVEEFVAEIELQGNPDNRYNSFGVQFNSGYLFALDSYIFHLRQKIGVPPIYEEIRKMDADLVEIFNLYNPWFASVPQNLAEIPNEYFPLRISNSVTTLDILTGAHAPLDARYVLGWLNKKMKLPTKVVRHMRGI